MAEVMNMPAESLDRRRDRQSERKEKSVDETPSSTLPPEQPPSGIPPSSRRRDRDSRERRVDERDIIDRPGPGGAGDGAAAGGGNRNHRDYHHDNNRNIPPPRDRDRERDRERDNRDYKRRSSLSPPPPYRDRRGGHSPPPFKRSRRDDGPNFDGRRGSPRGGGGGGRGFGPPGDDRRFGYDYAGGYERGGPGGRGYGDERPYGRHMNRPAGGYRNGPSDWDSGRGGFNDALNGSSMQREGLMSYKQFIQELEDDILPAEAERRYQEYRSEYISTQKRAYFDAHKDDEWLKDKYHPTNLVSVIERRNEAARKVAKDFMLDLQSGTLDIGPGVSPTLANKSGNGSDPNSEDEAETGSKRRRHGRGPVRENDLLSAAPKAHPVSSEPRRIEADIGQAQSLVRKLDKEKGIEENILCSADDKDGAKSHGGSMGPIIIIRGLTSVKGLEGMELLDTLLTYLWRVHGLDYYGMIETNEAKGLRHVRVEGKTHDETSTAAVDWEKKVDSSWQARLAREDPLEVMTGKEKIEEATVEGLDPFVRKIRDEKYGWKYGCGAKGCTKLFHAAEFVHKHLRLKHLDLVGDLTSKVREELYFYNYMNDSNAPGGQPVMQQPLPREMPQRRRQNLDNQRLRDDRGNHHRRDHDRNDRGINGGGDERFDKTENSPSRDVQPNTTGGGGDGRGGDPDEPMYDTYGAGGGPGLHGAPFPSDIHPPPPVLMPVPGAGPLGPFVPAPPEVAMRMLREQGGGPFEGNGGRNGRGGPQVIGGGPAPIIAVSPAFRPDPRRLRSYQDLDAPEDEVTVIDYRSL